MLLLLHLVVVVVVAGEEKKVKKDLEGETRSVTAVKWNLFHKSFGFCIL